MLVVLLLLLGAAGSQDTAERTVLCGRELAKAHSMYCYGIDPFVAGAVNSKIPSLLQTETTVRVPERFTIRAQLKSLNVYEACCIKPCYITELLDHC